ncbi:MAG: pyrroline-5-carboxylate reductase [Candidatus Omnitrophica bacterium]|nr:pyrroline-5-carboxylate reductase [Candidatus Omnitrophota bacterium]
MQKIGVIGCGNMGSAIIDGIVRKKVFNSHDIYVYDIDSTKIDNIIRKYGINAGELNEIVNISDIVLLAVKPQESGNIFFDIKVSLDSTKTIVSIMAGVKLFTMNKALGENIAIVRAMPNLAAVIGESMTSYACNDHVKNKDIINKLFSAIGSAREVKEELLDAVTALSGSGPAYVFFLADALISAGIKAGLSEEDSYELAIKTIAGASSYLVRSGKNPSDLVKAVASKGGTTQAALNHFEEKQVKNTIIEAIQKAKERSIELSK